MRRAFHSWNRRQARQEVVFARCPWSGIVELKKLSVSHSRFFRDHQRWRSRFRSGGPPLEPEWLRQMWRGLAEGPGRVLQRDTEEGGPETFSYGAEGLQWVEQELQAAGRQSEEPIRSFSLKRHR